MAVKAAVRIVYRRVARSPLAPILRLPPLRRVHGRLTATRVDATDVVEITSLLRGAGAEVKLLGGWACDALLGKQTREHGDVDLLLRDADREQALQTLEQAGFERIYTFDSPPLAANVVELTDHRLRRCASLHFTDLSSDEPWGFRGILRARLSEAGFDPDEQFATGTVGGREVDCLSPPAQLVLHSLHEPNETQRRDMQLLKTRFSLGTSSGDDAVSDAAS